MHILNSAVHCTSSTIRMTSQQTLSKSVSDVALEISESDAQPAAGEDSESNGATQMETTSSTERPTWGRSIEFLLSCISMSVGLGNIWRFPFTAYENGGGAFLIPYLVVLLVIGKPMYYMEMILGQFSSKGSVKAWRALPLFGGIGAGQIFAISTVIAYYCALLAIALHYLYASFASELPWSRCQPEWAANCVDSKPRVDLPGNFTVGGQMSSSELYFM